MAQVQVSDLLSEAIEIVGLKPLADNLGVTYQAIRKWQRAGHLPRTEWTGETAYAASIERLTKRRVPKSALLSAKPQKAAA